MIISIWEQGTGIFEELIFIAIFYLGTYYILKNKVNLQ